LVDILGVRPPVTALKPDVSIVNRNHPRRPQQKSACEVLKFFVRQLMSQSSNTAFHA
jgi:hypothetical protein